MIRQCSALLAIAILFTATLWGGGVLDNRYIDQRMAYRPMLRHQGTCSWWAITPYLSSATQAYDATGSDTLDDVPFSIYDLYGTTYNQVAIDNAARLAGYSATGFLRSDLRGSIQDLPWDMTGQFNVYGFGFNAHHRFTDLFSIGGFVAFARQTSFLILKSDTVSSARLTTLLGQPGDQNDIFIENEQMLEALGLEQRCYTKDSASDLDFYLQFGPQEEYSCRTRWYDGGIRLGMLAPTAPRRDQNNPASFPIGGDGLWGVYGAVIVDTILREDLRAGFDARILQRLHKTQPYRATVMLTDMDKGVGQPINFGAYLTPLTISPGITYTGSFYAAIDNLRAGLGFEIGYSFIAHTTDSYCATACTPTNANLAQLSDLSPWRSECIMLGLFYDFGYDDVTRRVRPIFSLLADIPITMMFAQSAGKSFGVAMRVELDF